MPSDPNAPVLVAVAQKTWREPDLKRTPMSALLEVGQAALDSCGGQALTQAIDTVATVRFIMETDPNLTDLIPRNPGHLLAKGLGIENAASYQAVIGGNTPQYLVNHFAERLAEGEVNAVLIAGAECLNTFFDALRQGHDINSWKSEDSDAPTVLGKERDGLNASEKAHDLYAPINTYPLFENALRHQLGDGVAAETAALCANMAAVAADNPYAWLREGLNAEQLAAVTDKNRIIGYPYTKAMNAVLSVDMAAAIVMTTSGKALELGIPADQLVYLRAGADVNETWHVSERPDLARAPAIGLAANAVLQHAGLALDDIDRFDIYSCFPCAVAIACREIGMSPLDERGVTVTGGLPFFGGPGNNYSLHAIASMVEQLREQRGNGLVTANGLYLTKHSLGLYSTEPGESPWQALKSEPLQAAIDSAEVTTLAPEAAGPVTVESFTVAFDRKGPSKGYIVARNADNERVLANTSDAGTMKELLDSDPIGRSGTVQSEGEKNLFSF